MDGFNNVTVQSPQGAVTVISFDGGRVVTGDSGASLIPGFSFYAGVPAQGSVKVTLEPQEISVLRVNNPLQKRTSAKTHLDPVFSSRWISEPAYSHLRDYRAASLVIRPVNDIGGGRIQLLKKARIVIDFPASVHSGARWEPKSDYERMVRRLFLNFNVSQGWQQSERRTLRKALESQDPFPFVIDQQLASFKVSGVERGNEASTKGNKLIKISGSKIRDLFGGNVQINSVALYASIKGELDHIVPREGEIPAGVFEVPLLRPNRSGFVNDDDEFIAYVSGSSDWSYSSNTERYSFILNRYDDKRAYWLTVKRTGDGKSMSRFDQPAAAAFASEDFEANIYMREPKLLSSISTEGGGIDWVWKRFSAGRTDTTIQLDLPGLLKNERGSISFDIGSAGSVRNIEARLGSAAICRPCTSNTHAEIDNWDSNNLSINGQNSLQTELNGIHVRYRRPITVSGLAKGDRLEILSSAAYGTASYKLAKTENDLAYIVRVPVDERDVSLIDTVRTAGYTWSDVGNQGTRYIVMAQNNIVDYSDSLKRVTYTSSGNSFLIRDLRGTVSRTETRSDYLIITHEDFTDAALKLAEHKKTYAGFNYPKVVLLSDLQNQFGGGNMDPASIRNFLLFVYRNWEQGNNLDYVTLVGLGHYDYKYVNTRQPNFMPVAYRTNGRHSNHNWVTDDYFVFFDTHIHPDSQHFSSYFLGRLPARSSSEAFDIVEKIIEMENPAEANFDSWRNRVLLTADDDMQGNDRDYTSHYISSERVGNIIWRNRPAADLRKVYLFEYPRDDYHVKPGSTRAFINEINNGVAAVNWFGHGSANQLADELMFSRTDVLALHNRKRYPVFSFFSCSVGKFDLPGTDCLSAQLVRQPRAGAIGVVSATRATYASHNDSLAMPFFEALFDPNDNLSIGASLQYGKNAYRYIDNRYYLLLGDPSITISRQNRKVDITIENYAGKSIDTLKALQQIKIKGSVNDAWGLDKDFTGSGAFVNVTLFNAPDTARRKDGGTYSNPVYELPGAPVFSAKVSVKDGVFEDSLLLPMNLSFGKQGVRLTAYAFKDTLMGTGVRTGLIFSGSESSNISDTIGPKISVRPIYGNLSMDMHQDSGLFAKNRISATLPFTLEIRVEAERGVNVIGSGPDEGLTIEVPGSLSKRSINHLFRPDDFNKGRAPVNFEENTLKSGVHELVVSAQDLLGNISRQKFTLEIIDPMNIKLDHVLNIPNPVRMGAKTRFYYYHSNTDTHDNKDLTVIIRVYSLGGRLLAVIRNPVNGHEWIPRDERGNMLTPNVYLYQVSVTSASLGKTTKSKIKKLVVHPPR